jgi:superfamily I DNA/RNA helicase
MANRAEIIKTFPRPVGRQAEVLALRSLGHVVVLGTAGSGKTTMAMLRALKLSDPRVTNCGRTLLVTYNRALLALLRPANLPDDDLLEVRTYHQFACGYLASRRLMDRYDIASEQQRRELTHAAVVQVAANHATVIGRGVDFAVAEIEWLSRNGVGTLDQYQQIERTGRIRSFDRGEPRERMWAVYEAYRDLRASAGYRYDWHDVAGAMLAEIVIDDDPRYYRHIVIDEGQDFSPQMLRTITAAAAEDGSVTFFGDAAQQIYGRGLSWRSAGFHDIGKVWEFARNYRNSPQIAALGLAIAEMPYFAGQPDMVRPDEFADAGPPPTLRMFESVADELAWVSSQAAALGKLGSAAVLFRRGNDARAFVSLCGPAQPLDRDTQVWTNEPGVWASTVHSAKGFEFQSVILCGLSADRWPEPEAIAGEGEEEATAVDGRLLYVAVSRARQNLLLTATVQLTALMPENHGLWLEIS